MENRITFEILQNILNERLAAYDGQEFVNHENDKWPRKVFRQTVSGYQITGLKFECIYIFEVFDNPLKKNGKFNVRVGRIREKVFYPLTRQDCGTNESVRIKFSDKWLPLTLDEAREQIFADNVKRMREVADRNLKYYKKQVENLEAELELSRQYAR